MKITSIFLTCLLGMLSFCLGQRVYKPGYVVTTDRDTLHGQLMNFGERGKSAQVMFLPQGETQSKHFRPIDLIAYEIGGERYITSELSVIEDYDPQVTLSDPIYIPKHDTVLAFIAVLIHGEMSLYRLTHTDNRELLFASNSDSEIKPLLSLTYEHYDVGTRYIRGTYTVKHEKYKAVLAELMRQCPTSYERIARVHLSATELRRFFSDYHQCVHNSGPYYEFPNTREVSIQIGPLLEGFRESSDLVGSGAYWFDEAARQTQYGIGAGVALEITLKRGNDQVSILTGASLREITQSGTTQYEEIAGNIEQWVYDILNYKFQGRILELPLELRYNLPIGNVKPFALAGVNLNISRLDSNVLRRSRFRDNEVYASETQALINENTLAKAGYTFRLGVGVKGPHWFVSLRYQSGIQLAAGKSILRDRTSGIFFSTAWMFGKP